MHQPAEPINIENNLRRARGRSARNYVASARVTKAEQDELEEAARSEGKALSEWCREVLLAAARGETITPIFAEIVAIRQLLNSTLRNVACGAVMTPEGFQAELQGIRSSKHKAAAEVMQQYASNRISLTLSDISASLAISPWFYKIPPHKEVTDALQDTPPPRPGSRSGLRLARHLH